MTFMPPISAPIVAPIATPGGAVVPWYLLGGVTAAQCVAAYQPKGAADLAASYVNLNNPGTYNAAPGTAPTLGASGWTFNGTTQYLTTGIAPNQDYSIIIQFSNRSGALPDQVVIGERENTTKVLDILWESPNWYLQNQTTTGGHTKSTPSFDAGNLCIAGLGCYKDGLSFGTLDASTFSSSFGLYIGASQNTVGVAGFFYGGNVAAVAIYNIALSSTQVGLISTAMAAL